MDAQDRVAEFASRHDLGSTPPYRVLDLVSEVGEVAKEVNTATSYGDRPTDSEVATDEIGDVLFALLALCNELDIDAAAALESALAKYESRIDGTGDPGSDGR